MKTKAYILCGSLAAFAMASLSVSAQDADSCAAALDASAKLIYDDAVGDVTADSDIREIVTEHTKALVKAGKLTRGEARSAATAAGECLKLVKG